MTPLKLHGISGDLRDGLVIWLNKNCLAFFAHLNVDNQPQAIFDGFQQQILEFTPIPWPEDRVERIEDGDELVSSSSYIKSLFTFMELF